MKVFAFDIETIADKSMLGFLPEVSAAGNLKDPEKIKADIEAKKKKQVAEMGLNPLTNIICCIGWCTEAGPDALLLDHTKPEVEAEKALIEAWWEIAHQNKDAHFVTFNGRPFDLRCILLHGMALGVRPSVTIDRGRYNKGNHTDLRQILAGEDTFAKGKLDFFAQKFLGKKKTEGIDGAMVQDFWEMRLFEDIVKYCENDTIITYELFQKAWSAGLID